MAGNVDEMRKPELMKYAAFLGVATRREGTKQWRVVADVRADCKLREQHSDVRARQQHSPASAGGPGSASSSQGTPSAPSTGAPTQVVGGAVQQKQSLAHAGGPGSASSNQAAPSANVAGAPERTILAGSPRDPLSKYWSEQRQRKVRRLLSEPASPLASAGAMAALRDDQ